MSTRKFCDKCGKEDNENGIRNFSGPTLTFEICMKCNILLIKWLEDMNNRLAPEDRA